MMKAAPTSDKAEAKRSAASSEYICRAVNVMTSPAREETRMKKGGGGRPQGGRKERKSCRGWKPCEVGVKL